VFCDKIKKKSQHSNTQVEVNIDYEENTEIPEKLETRRSQRLQIKGKMYTLFYFNYIFFY
jgi:tRNA U34 5-carboxymethylaminomethyl modifying GTPase MnmE/TrmE